MTLLDLDKLAAAFSGAHQEFVALGTELEADLAHLRQRYAARIRRGTAKVADTHGALSAGITNAKHLFARPKTLVLHGIKVGYQKGKGGIVFGDPDTVVRLIEKHFADQADLLLHIKKCPNKEALEKLTVAELKRLGCEVADAGDRIVIKPMDGEVAKLVAGLLKELASEEA